MRKVSGWFLLLILSFLGGKGSLAEAHHPQASLKPVLLYILVEDGQAFTEEGRIFMTRLFQENLPNHRIALIRTTDGRYFSDEEKVHDSLVRGVKKALKPGEVITHLVIATHGGTEVEEGLSRTTLRGVGDFTKRGPDEMLTEILDPLRGRFAPDTHVILDSCSTMCGTTPAARDRAQAFMTSIGAPDGSLYGATNPDVDVQKLGADARTWSRLKPRWNLLRNVALFSFAVGAPIAWLGLGGETLSPQPLVAHAQVTAVSTLLLTALFQYMEPAMIWFYERTRSINEGRLFAFKGGRFQKSERLSKRIESLGRIYSLQKCVHIWKK